MWLLLAWLFCAIAAQAATPVVIAPVPKQQFFDNAGRPLAFGCVFAYQSGTTTLLSTYTDATGNSVNPNPLILDSAGRGGGSGSTSIFIAAGQAYTLKVKAAGGTACASGTTLYTIDGIGGGLTLLTTLVTCNTTCSFPISSQIQLFAVSLTGNSVANPLTAVGVIPPAIVIFQITQDGAGGHSFSWPANSIGGAPIGLGSNQVTTQEFIWNGSNATAIGPAVTGTGPALSAGSIALSGQLLSSLATGTAPFVIASTTKVANLNVDLLDGFDWAIPGAIGSTTPSSGIFTTLEAQTSFKLNGSTVETAVQGSDTHLMSAGSFAGATGDPLCRSANAGATDQGCSGGSGYAISKTTSGYIKLPTALGGLVLNWLQGPTDTGSTEVVESQNWALAFPTAVLNVSISYLKLVASSTSDDCWYQVQASSTTNVTWMKQNTGGTCQDSKAYVFAVGY